MRLSVIRAPQVVIYVYLYANDCVRVISLAVHSGHNVVILGENDVILIDTCERSVCAKRHRRCVRDMYVIQDRIFYHIFNILSARMFLASGSSL